MIKITNGLVTGEGLKVETWKEHGEKFKYGNIEEKLMELLEQET